MDNIEIFLAFCSDFAVLDSVNFSRDELVSSSGAREAWNRAIP